jgi:hypothetical protein
MLPMMVVTLMLAVISIGANMMIPRSVATQAALAASKSAINLVLYQNALMTYKATNPGFSGTVSSASLTWNHWMVKCYLSKRSLCLLFWHTYTFRYERDHGT